MYQVYQLRENANVTLSLLSLSHKRKIKCYNEYFINRHVFHIEEYEQSRNHITIKFMLKDRLLMSLKLTTMGSSKRSLNCNIIESKIKYFYSNVIGMTPMIEELE
jgi:hypothetical protein